VDFLVVTEGELDAEAERAARQLHAALPEQESEWARHLEGSYVSRAELRREERGEREGRAWLYVDNGSRVMEWSSHDDSAVTRWGLREHGIVLDGPAPDTLLGDVRPERLRAEAVSAARAIADVARDPALLATRGRNRTASWPCAGSSSPSPRVRWSAGLWRENGRSATSMPAGPG
jgi:hypothetical protein